MNLIILSQDDFIAEKKVRLSDRRFEHIKSIHRAEHGQTLKVGLLDGLMGEGLITKFDDDCVEMTVELFRKPPEAVPLTLVMALPRPPTLKKVLQGSIEMGIKRIILISSNRVEKSFWQSKVLKEDQLLHQLLLGLEQAVDTALPVIEFRKKFKPFVEDDLPELIKGSTAFVAHPVGGTECPYNLDSPITLVVGPEGGFIPYEVEQLVAAGCKPIHLGPRIMRVEHAVFSLISKLT